MEATGYSLTDAEVVWLVDVLRSMPPLHPSRLHVGEAMRNRLLDLFRGQYESVRGTRPHMTARAPDDPVCVNCKLPRSARHHDKRAALAGGLKHCEFDPLPSNAERRAFAGVQVITDPDMEPGKVALVNESTRERVEVEVAGWSDRMHAHRERLRELQTEVRTLVSALQNARGFESLALTAQARRDLVLVETLGAVMDHLQTLSGSR